MNKPQARSTRENVLVVYGYTQRITYIREHFMPHKK